MDGRGIPIGHVVAPSGLTRGPRNATPASEARHEGGARRTISIDVPFPDVERGRGRVEVRARDLLTGPGGAPVVRDAVSSVLQFDLDSGLIEHVTAGDTGAAAPDPLVGASVRSGFVRSLTAALPTASVDRSLPYAAFEDVPGVVFVAGFALLKAGYLTEDPSTGPARAAHQADVCAGWATGTPLLQILERDGRAVVPTGPVAPELEAADPDGWHELPTLDQGTVRRRRCLDAAPAPGGGFTLVAHMRDSYRDVDREMVLHEYVVRLALDDDGVVEAIEVEPRVLPWDECPSAAASAQRIVGIEVAELPGIVRGDLVGASTCTHLNSTIRTLADAASLIHDLTGEL